MERKLLKATNMGILARIYCFVITVILVGCDTSSKPSQNVHNQTPKIQTGAKRIPTEGDGAPAGKIFPQPERATSGSVATNEKPLKIRDDEHLHNVFKVHERVLSGGQPHGEEGFKALQELGVKTVISVDGAKPDVDLAKKYGLRYVHLPHGYDGVPEERVKELAKAVRDLEGPVYIHCKHGKHRSPAASAVACVAAGLIAPESALGILEAAGTSKGYRGLYQSVEEAKKLDQELLNALDVEFMEIADVPAMADAMVEMEHHHDHLKQIAQNQWRLLPDHPDLAPGHEALMLREHITELLRTDEVKAQPAKFQALMKEAEVRAQTLEDGYRAWERSNPVDGLKRLQSALEAVNQNCAACHKQFRDVPLHEKGKH